MRPKWILILALGGLTVACGVGFLTFVRPPGSNHTRSSRKDDGSPLRIESEQTSSTTEQGSDGFRDFRFENLRDNAVTLGVDLKDCQCARVQICLVPAEWKGLSLEARRGREAESVLTWETLNEESQTFTVPPLGEGLLRLGWTAKREGNQRFWARLWFDDEGNRTHQRVEAIVRVIPPVFVSAEADLRSAEVDVGRLIAGDSKTAVFLCYSETRHQILVTATPAPSDTCLNYGEPQALTEAELKTLSEKTGATVRAGYRLAVTARERAGDARLDIGPFRRLVNWATDVFPGHRIQGVVSGSVDGEVKLADAVGQTFVDLGQISPDEPAPVTFALVSNDPHLELSVDEKSTLHFLLAELLDGKEGKSIKGSKSWRVRVQYRKDSDFRGPFPLRERPGYDSEVACSIVFQLARQSPSRGATGHSVRRLFVPVHGVVQRAY
jgi:hypothetical protein